MIMAILMNAFLAAVAAFCGSMVRDIVKAICFGIYHTVVYLCCSIYRLWTLMCVSVVALPAAIDARAKSALTVLDSSFQWLWHLPRVVYETACLFQALAVLLCQLRTSIRHCETVYVELREFVLERKQASATLMAKVDAMADSEFDFWLCMPIIFCTFLGESAEKARVLGAITFFTECSFEDLRKRIKDTLLNFSKSISFEKAVVRPDNKAIEINSHFSFPKNGIVIPLIKLKVEDTDEEKDEEKDEKKDEEKDEEKDKDKMIIFHDAIEWSEEK